LLTLFGQFLEILNKQLFEIIHGYTVRFQFVEQY
jgi:hypothetical protein